MDTFRINSPFDKNDFIRVNLIKWKFHNRKFPKILKTYSIVSVFFFFFWIIAKTEEDPTNLFLVLGLVFSGLTLLLAYVRIYSKRSYTRKLKEMAEKYDSVKMDCSYEFLDKSIKYWDKEKKLEFNWSCFTNYSIYKNCLILILNNSAFESYIFERKETDINEYNQILEIVSSKLEYKETN